MDSFEKFYNSALRFLSYRPRSEKEIREKLQKKKALPEIIESVVKKLREQKFLNDEEFTRWWIESRLRFKLRSINIIKRELLQKGVNRELIDTQISNFSPRSEAGKFQISNELENAQKLIEKKIKQYEHFSKREIYQKLGSFLARRGFDFETIKKAIDEVLDRRYNEGERQEE